MTLSSEPTPREAELFLGLDIGAASIGWALVELAGGKPAKLKAAGVRAFAAGVEGDISAGRDQSRAGARREARLRRRLLARRRHRLTKLARILQRNGLLPPGELQRADALIDYFNTLDRGLFPPASRREEPHLLLHRLRARALDEKLTPSELGRALYHLAQRRGFLSNRRAKPKPAGVRQSDEEKEEGKVKTAIGKLAESIAESGARTLGEYLSRLNPEEERVRNRYLGRGMLQDEFEAIWQAQAAHHPDLLTDDLKSKVHEAIFFQRPLKSQRHLIGECDLEKGRRRAPLAALAAQRFRLLQKVNDLRAFLPTGEERALTPEERAKLADALERQGDLTFGKVRTLLGLPRGSRFNFETEGEKGLIGNRTARKLAGVFGEEGWAGLPPEERERAVSELRSIHNREALRRRAMKLWALDEDAGQRFAEVPLEDGYCNLSQKALAKVLPLMEKGMPYASARKEIYGDQPGPSVLDVLPRLDSVLDVRNPAVERALTELRKVANAIAQEYGRPACIRVELARDLKKTRKDRKDIASRNARNRRDRQRAAEEIVRQAGIPEPRRADTERWLLAEECGWQCPYTGKQISVDALFGDHPQFDVEHIIPFHRCLDNSFINKTLCDIAENRAGKQNRSPWEAYGHDEERWAEITARVKSFKGGAARPKLERFQIRDVATLDDFTSQQLNDTRYASRLAVEYLGLLYGAGADGVAPDGRRRVQASRGAVTGFLRNEWGLNAILGGGEKTRDDHRQHAIDAVVVALTEPAAIKRLSDAAANAALARRRRFAPVQPPWAEFGGEVRAAIESMVVSHRVSRKVAAALHEETIYSAPTVDVNGKSCVHIRKPLDKLSAGDVDTIVDEAVQKAVQRALDDLRETDPAKAFASPENHPSLRAADGRDISIHKVRLRVPVSPERIGQGASARNVKLGSNHHVEILETTDKRGDPCWEGCVVSTLEAMRRLRAKEPVVRRDHGRDKKFLFSLAGGEVIFLDADESKKGKTAAEGLYVVRTVTVSGGRPAIAFVGITDARLKKDIQAAGDWGTSLIEPLRKRGCRKVVVTPLGEVRRAND